MFERFTTRARHTIVLAQEEARALQHNYIGTEHLLLGLLGEPDGLAGRALAGFGLSLATAREQVTARVGLGKRTVNGHIPFTPRAKKVLELALREALALHHNYIGTEHLLLGMIREADGVGAELLRAEAGDLLAVRMSVLDIIPAAAAPPPGRRWLSRFGIGSPETPVESDEPRTSPAADNSLEEAARLAGSRPVGSHHLLLAAIGDANSAAAQVLTTLGLDLDQTREALLAVDISGTSDEQPEDAGRRHLLLRTTEDTVTIEVTDPSLVALARATVQALDGQSAEPGVIRGDDAITVSLGTVWRAIRDSLEDIRRRADSAGSPAEPAAG